MVRKVLFKRKPYGFFVFDMNTSHETEHLQNALTNLATVIAKIITERVDQTLNEVLPVKLPAPSNDKPAEDRILKKKQVAELFQVSTRTVDSWMEHGYLPHWKIGRNVRFRMSDILACLDERAGRRKMRRWR